MTERAHPPLLELSNISKAFPGVQALKNVSLELLPGEVHALVGENGAGKSTLLKILFGVYAPDEGTVSINGKPVDIRNPRDAYHAGIAMIHQELQQIPELNVTQNIFLGQPLSHFGILKNSTEMNRIAQSLLKRLDVDLDIQSPITRLSVAQRQLVEIAKALLGNARIIAMDEPTSSLAPVEFENLVRVIQELKADGVGIIYVTHRLNELFQIADRATILRDGQLVDQVNIADVAQSDLVRMMVGRKLDETQRHTNHTQSEVVLSVKELSWGKRVRNVSFDLHRGEILGVAGLVGAGRTEMVRLIAGVHLPTAGQILLNGKPVHFRTPRDAINAGVGLLPEDRKKQGIINLLPVLSNASLPILGRLSRAGWIQRRKRRAVVREVVDRVNLRPPNIDRAIRYFSGGNQQKAIIARWLCAKSDILIFDEPTRGIDVGAKQEIYTMMEQLAESGKAILMVSSELPEVLRLSDRVLVMREGQLMTTLARSELSEEIIMRYATASAKPDTEPDRIAWWQLEEVFGPLPIPQAKPRIGAIVKTLTNEYWQLLAKGYELAGEHYAINVDVQAAKHESDPAGQLAVADAMLTLDYDTLLVSPQSDTNLQPAFDRAMELGIPFVNVNDAIFPAAVNYIGPVQRENGERVARWFIEQLPAGGKVAVIEGQAGVYAVGQRTEGFVETIQKEGAGKFEVVARVAGDWDHQRAYDAASLILDQHPELIGFYCNNDSMALGVVEAVKARGLLNQVRVFGTDGTASAFESILAGELTGTVDLFPELTGEMALDVALRLLAGQPLPRVVATPQALVIRANYDRYKRDDRALVRAVLLEDAELASAE